MIGHYLAAALRSFRRSPLATVIKLLVLALGFACFLTANMVADHVRRSDRQWAEANRIYSIAQAVTSPGATQEAGGTIGAISGPAVEFLKTDFPDLTIAATNTLPLPLSANGVTAQNNLLAVDPAFFDIFDLETSGADPGAAISAPGAILLEAGYARQFFGAANPVGETVQVVGQDLQVAGVFEWPVPSHLGSGGTGKDIRAIISRDTIATLLNMGSGIAGPWNTTCCTTYTVLGGGAPSPAAFEARLQQFSETRVPPEFGEVRFYPMAMAEMSQAYLNLGLFGGSMDLSLVTILNAFAALVLAVACLDFANLATAEAASRAREIGLRKTVGATRMQVVTQAMVEVGLLSVAALFFVLPVAFLLVAPLGSAVRLDIEAASILVRPQYWLSIFALAIGVCLAAGLYPALMLARLRPTLSLRMTGQRGGAGVVRTALIVAQFAAASFLVVAVSVMLMQKAELRGRLIDPALDPRLSIAVVNVPGQPPTEVETLRTQLLSNSSITGVTTTATEPFRRAVITGLPSPTITRSGDPNGIQFPVQIRYVGYGYFDVAGIEIIAGRDFDPEQDSDQTGFSFVTTEDGGIELDTSRPPPAAIIDEHAVATLGMTPQQAVGELVYQPQQGSIPNRETGAPQIVTLMIPVRIVGVAAATPLEYMVEGPDVYLYRLEPRAASTMIVRVARADVAGALTHIDAVWRDFFPGAQIDRVFLDEAFDSSFASFNMLNTVFAALSAIAIAIAAMGLFGIASFVVQRRQREVGVRKTLGANSGRVLALMLWSFSKPVILANLIAWPVAWIAARSYLNLFVTRIDLTPAPFLLALFATLLIAWIAVGAHALRAARVKPALVLAAE